MTLAPAPLPPEEIERLDSLFADATDGPWSFANGNLVRITSLSPDCYGSVIAGAHKIGGSQETARKNAALITALRNAWPSIKAEIEAGRADGRQAMWTADSVIEAARHAWAAQQSDEGEPTPYQEGYEAGMIAAAEAVRAQAKAMMRYEAGRAGAERVRELEALVDKQAEALSDVEDRADRAEAKLKETAASAVDFASKLASARQELAALRQPAQPADGARPAASIEASWALTGVGANRSGSMESGPFRAVVFEHEMGRSRWELRFGGDRLRGGECYGADHFGVALRLAKDEMDRAIGLISTPAAPAQVGAQPSELGRLRNEVASLRASLGQPADRPAEPIGCPAPGACSCPSAQSAPDMVQRHEKQLAAWLDAHPVFGPAHRAYEASKAAQSAGRVDAAGDGCPEWGARCERCQGNGEIIVDEDRYAKPLPGDRGDEAVATCPDCNGVGHHATPPTAGAVEGD